MPNFQTELKETDIAFTKFKQLMATGPGFRLPHIVIEVALFYFNFTKSLIATMAAEFTPATLKNNNEKLLCHFLNKVFPVFTLADIYKLKILLHETATYCKSLDDSLTQQLNTESANLQDCLLLLAFILEYNDFLNGDKSCNVYPTADELKLKIEQKKVKFGIQNNSPYITELNNWLDEIITVIINTRSVDKTVLSLISRWNREALSERLISDIQQNLSTYFAKQNQSCFNIVLKNSDNYDLLQMTAELKRVINHFDIALIEDFNSSLTSHPLYNNHPPFKKHIDSFLAPAKANLAFLLVTKEFIAHVDETVSSGDYEEKKRELIDYHLAKFQEYQTRHQANIKNKLELAVNQMVQWLNDTSASLAASPMQLGR